MGTLGLGVTLLLAVEAARGLAIVTAHAVDTLIDIPALETGSRMSVCTYVCMYVCTYVYGGMVGGTMY